MVRGYGFNVFMVYFLGFLVCSLYNLAKSFKISEGNEKIHIRYVFFGTLSAAFVGTFFNLFFPLILGNAKLTFL
jgi:hypothetical protein